MEQEMNTGEEIEKLAKENRTWEILEILRECKDLEEAKERVKALLSKYARHTMEYKTGGLAAAFLIFYYITFCPICQERT